VIEVKRHAVAELRLADSSADGAPGRARPWLEVSDPSGRLWRLPVFLTRGHGWGARYSSRLAGVHAFRWLDSVGLPLTHAPTGTISVGGAENGTALDRHGPIRVAEDRRHFEHEDGTPFLWLADTWWHVLSPRIGDEELRRLVRQRVEQGFTAAQIVVGPLPEVREGEPAGVTVGGFAWEARWSEVRPAFFDAADRRIAMLLEGGLVPVIVGAWGYHLEDAGVAVMAAHWRELVARYAAYPVVWIAAGEASMPWYDRLLEADAPVRAARLARDWASVARATRALDPFGRPMTVHPSPAVSAYSSLDVFDDGGLTDFVMLQTGHWDRASLPGTMDALVRSLDHTPRQPVLNGEVCYEGIMGASWPDLQRYLWWAQVLSGAAGHTYGAQGLWSMNDGTFMGHVGDWGSATWREAAALPGAAHLGAGRRWLAERPWVAMAPSNERLLPHAEPGRWLRPYAATLADGRLIAYLPGAALMDGGASDPRTYREVSFGGFAPGTGVRLAYFDPRSMELRLEEERTASDAGWVSVTRTMLAAMPSLGLDRRGDSHLRLPRIRYSNRFHGRERNSSCTR
jgi:hypothetical protein